MRLPSLVAAFVLGASPLYADDSQPSPCKLYFGGIAGLAWDGEVSLTADAPRNPATNILHYTVLGGEMGYRRRGLGMHAGLGYGRVSGDETSGWELELRVGVDGRILAGPIGLVGRVDLAAVDANYSFQGDTTFVALAAEPRAGLEVQVKSCWVDLLAGPRVKSIAWASGNQSYVNPQTGWSLGVGVFCTGG